MAKVGIVFAVAVAVAGCNPPLQPVSRQKTENGMEATLIAVVDGCRLWEVRGSGHAVYFTNCGPGAARTQWTVASGKTRSTRSTVPALSPTPALKEDH